MFGFEQLRPGQEEAILAAADGRDTLAVLPTGAGKSAIYQLAALIIPGPTIVVSPLIALQRDQVAALLANGSCSRPHRDKLHPPDMARYAAFGIGAAPSWAYFLPAGALGAGPSLMPDERTNLTELIRNQLAARDVCEVAGTYLLEVELRERLAVLGVEPTPDVSVALMAVAMLLAEKAPEWGGDCRDALGEIAQLGLSLLMDGTD